MASSGISLFFALVWALMATTTSAKPGDAPFCRMIVASLLKCPVVPTVDTVDLNKYSGQWFGIGSTAQFQFAYFGDQGGQCGNANYTALGVVNGSNTIRVVNRGLVVTTQLRQAQAYAISSGAFASGVGVRFLCQFLVGEAALTSLFPALENVDQLLPNLAKLPALANVGAPSEAQMDALVKGLLRVLDELPAQYQGGVTVAKGMIGRVAAGGAAPGNTATPAAAVVGGGAKGGFQLPEAETAEVVKAAVQLLYKLGSLPKGALSAPISVASLTNILTVAAAVSETLGPADKVLIKAESVNILSAVDAASDAASEVFESLDQIQLANSLLTGSSLPAPIPLPKALGDIQLQVSKLAAAELAFGNATAQILASADIIKATAMGKDKAVTQAAAAIVFLAAEQGPLDLAARDIAAGGKVIGVSAESVTPEELQNRPISVEGQAVQSATNAGALTVTFGYGNPTSPNYNIIKLVGPAETGYDLAVVFGCDPSITTAYIPQTDYFILSRTRDVPQAVIEATLASAAQQGILLGGENPFIVASQDPALCRQVQT